MVLHRINNVIPWTLAQRQLTTEKEMVECYVYFEKGLHALFDFD